MVDGLAASGGYITAIAGDHIVAKQTSLVGSIGVLFQYPNVTDLLGKIGVKVEERSNPRRSRRRRTASSRPARRRARRIESLVKDSYAWFKGLVQSRAALDDEELADGRRRARLHRPSGDRAQARSTSSATNKTGIAWLAKEKNIDAKLPVRDYKLHDRFRDLPFLHAMAAATLDAARASARWRGSIDRLGCDAGRRAAQP